MNQRIYQTSPEDYGAFARRALLGFFACLVLFMTGPGIGDIILRSIFLFSAWAIVGLLLWTLARMVVYQVRLDDVSLTVRTLTLRLQWLEARWEEVKLEAPRQVAWPYPHQAARLSTPHGQTALIGAAVIDAAHSQLERYRARREGPGQSLPQFVATPTELTNPRLNLRMVSGWLGLVGLLATLGLIVLASWLHLPALYQLALGLGVVSALVLGLARFVPR